MEKAYDLKVLASNLKQKGLIQAEDAAEDVVKEVFAWLKESAVLSENPYDDMAVIIYPKAEEMILAQVDKIDGQEG